MATRRPPTAAEKEQWKKAVAEIDEKADREQVLEILQQMKQTGIDQVIDRLKAYRKSQGISLRTLEETSGIPRGNLSRIENHQHTPGLSTLQSYAAALGKSVRVVVVDE
ncbi:MAG: helix-turn-helix transcriptional regulator [Fuerstiella sp.]